MRRHSGGSRPGDQTSSREPFLGVNYRPGYLDTFVRKKHERSWKIDFLYAYDDLGLSYSILFGFG